MKKVTLLALFVLLALCSFASCGQDDDTLYYLNFKPEVASVYTDIAASYKAETGKKLRVVTAASGTYEQTLKSEIGKNDPPVLFQINGPKGYAAWKDYCLDLSDSKIYEHLADKALAITDGDGLYGVPSVVEGYGIIVNTAITDRYFALESRQKTVNALSEINSFEKLRTVVEDMTVHKSELGIEGVFASTSLKSGEDWRFHTHLANIPLYYEFEARNVDLSGDGTKTITFQYADKFRQIFDLYLNNSCTEKQLLGTKQVTDSMAEFALGKCAMVQNGTWAWSQISEVTGNTVEADKLCYLPIYMGIPGEENMGLAIGTENFFAVNKKVSPEKQKLALDFLEWLYTSETGKDYVTNRLEFIAPFDSFEENERPTDPLAVQLTEYMNDDSYHTVPWCFTIFPGQTFKDDFGAALLQYAQGTKTWDDVKNVFVTRWEQENS